MADLLPPIVVELLARSDAFKTELASARSEMSGFAADVEGHTSKVADAEEAMATRGGKATKDLEGAHKDLEGKTGGFAARMESLFSGIGNAMGGIGAPFSESVSKMGEKIGEAETKGKGLGQALSEVGKVVTLGVGVGAVAAAAEAIHLGDAFASATGQLASSAGISEQAATKIGNAFKGIKGEESANELTAAYAQVAGQLGTVQGKALNARQAVQVMAASSDLADAKMGSLSQTTAALAQVMQAYGLKAEDAGQTSDILYGIATKTGTGIDRVANTVQRLHSQLGAATPPLADVGGLILDLANHGETGRQSISAVSSGMATLLKQTTGTAQGQATLAAQQQKLVTASNAVTNAQQSLKAIQDRIASGSAKGVQATDALTAAHLRLSQAQQAQKAAQVAVAATTADANGKLTAAGAEAQKLGLRVYDTSGKFVGMQSVITQLEPKLRGMTEQQQMFAVQQLFGATAGQKMLDTILAGPAAYDSATKAVTATGTAHAAAERQMKTLSGEGKVLASRMENIGTSAGQFLIPKLTDLANDTAEVIGWFEKHKAVAEALAGVIGGALSVAVAAFTVNKLAGMVRGVKDAVSNIGTLLQKLGILKQTSTDALNSAQAAGTKIEQAGQKAGQDLETAGTTAATDIEAGGQRAAGSIESGAATAETDIAAGGATAEADIAAGGASAEADLTAGGATAEADLAAGGATSEADMAAGGAGRLGPTGTVLGAAAVAAPAIYYGNKGLQKWGDVSGTAGTPDATSPGGYLGAYAGQQGWTPQQMAEYMSLVGSGQKITPQQFNAQIKAGPGAPQTSNAAPTFIPGQGWVASGTPTESVAPGRAGGGSVTAGRRYVVGENGPELFVPGVSGSITPNSSMSSAGAAGTTTNYNIGQLVLEGVQNPAQMETALNQKARLAAVAGGSARAIPHGVR